MEYIKCFIIFFFILLFYKYKSLFERFKRTKSNTSAVKEYEIKNDKIYKYYNGKGDVIKIKKLYINYLKNWDFVPKMNFDINNKLIIEDYYKNRLNKKNKPSNYIEQLLNIHKTIESVNMYHNDLMVWHFYVKNDKIYLIDYNNFSDKIKIYKNVKYKNRNDINLIIKSLK